MLLRHDGTAVVAIGQASHAWISGQLARAWGNDRFSSPSPREAVCLGAEQHDVGMAQWDLAPALNERTGLPQQFHELPRPVHLALWEAAPGRLLTQSRYAALLVSLHGTGLYERFPPRTDDPEVAAAVRAYLDGQRALQQELAAELGVADHGELRRNQRLLAAWDDLSLALCLRWAPHELRGVPGAGDDTVTLTLTPGGDGDGAHVLSPWPFSRDEVVVRCEGRRLEGRFTDERELHAALDAAPHAVLELTLRRG